MDTFMENIDNLTNTSGIEEFLLSAAYWVAVVLVIIFVIYLSVSFINFINKMKSRKASKRFDWDDFLL